MSMVDNKAVTEKSIIIINNKVTFIYIQFLFKLDVKNLSQIISKTKYTILVFQIRKLRFKKITSLDQGLKTSKVQKPEFEPNTK